MGPPTTAKVAAQTQIASGVRPAKPAGATTISGARPPPVRPKFVSESNVVLGGKHSNTAAPPSKPRPPASAPPGATVQRPFFAPVAEVASPPSGSHAPPSNSSNTQGTSDATSPAEKGGIVIKKVAKAKATKR